MPKIPDAAPLPGEAMRVVHGLGVNPVALAIVLTLADDGPCTFGQLADVVEVRRATLSDNLRSLEDQGYVIASLPRTERRGRRHCTWQLDRAALLGSLDALRAKVAGGDA